MGKSSCFLSFGYPSIDPLYRTADESIAVSNEVENHMALSLLSDNGIS